MKNIIFDADGTLFDSMPFWKNFARKFAGRKGAVLPPDFDKRTAAMDLDECAVYFAGELGINEEPEHLKNEAVELIRGHFLTDIPMKKGMRELLYEEKSKKSRMCIFTTSEKKCIINAVKRLGIQDCFEEIFTVYDIGINKRSPESYLKVCELMHFKPEETVVYEDVYHAIQSAKQAGCKVTAVYDAESADDWEKIKKCADSIFE
jgi:thiamine-phosphate pyrophosphorylase